nr:acyl-CoA dehydrogenase family protein [uncultured Bacillus sp.]
MDFTLSDEQVLIQQSIKEIAQDLSGLSVNKSLKSLGEMDFLGMYFPEEVGGAGGEFSSYILALEELAKVSPSTALAYAIHSTQAASILNKWGNDEQKKSYLAPLCKGERIGSFAYGEAWAGKDMLAIETTALKLEDSYLLNGSKTFVLNGSEADLYIVFAKTEEGLTAFVVEKEAPGVTFSDSYKKMGLDELPIVTLTLENVQVPTDNVIGKEGLGEEIYQSAKDLHSISLAAIGTGISAVALEKSISYGKEREQFNRPIIKFEGLQEMIGNMKVHLSAAHLLTLQAASLVEREEDYKEAAAIARFYSLKTGEQSCLDAIQIHGGYGYSKDLGVEVLLRDIKGISLLEVHAKPMIISIARHVIG